MTIYLYVKTHRKTGLKYLGKTECKDPFKYKGSGKYWSNHIKKYGYEVETEILRECHSDEEVRQWGLYYSELWQVVASEDWANLKEEAGDGFTSEQARQHNLKRVANGTHHFSDSEFARQHNLKRVANGTHHFCNSDFHKQHNLKRVANGTHHFCNSDFHIQASLKRVENGTHNMLGGEIQRQRVANGTHNFLDSEIARQNNLKRVADGTHPSQTQWTCPQCGKSGRGTTNFNRWHGDNCKGK